jgi:hypothetical protein
MGELLPAEDNVSGMGYLISQIWLGADAYTQGTRS